jgi:hypothetical protein
MPLTSDQLTLARSWIGNTEEDDVFGERFDRLGTLYGFNERTLDRAIEESLRAQLAVLTLDQPTSVTVGDLSLSFGQNLIALQSTLKDFLAKGGTAGAAETAGSGGFTVAKLYRVDPTRS